MNSEESVTFIREFDKPISELLKRIEELDNLQKGFASEALQREIKRLQEEVDRLQEVIYSRLTPWEKTLVARHQDRPHTLDIIKYIASEFIELHGDRISGDDPSIIAGFGRIEDLKVAIVGNEKGSNQREREKRNYGMTMPCGFHKAVRIMNLAEKFGLPVITFVDTPGADPGMEAEANGQAMAIARVFANTAKLQSPVVSVVTGEGGSGGALALAMADRIYILENAIFSVISPEGCAAIIFRDAKRAPEAARALKLTSKDLLELGIVDGIIKEPRGCAHRNHKQTAIAVKETIIPAIKELMQIPLDELLRKRYEKFRKIGVFQIVK